MDIKRLPLSRSIPLVFSGSIFCLSCPLFSQVTGSGSAAGWCILCCLPLGLCIRVLSRYAEGFYFLTWSGHPGCRLLEGRDIRWVRFYSGNLAKSFLQLELHRTSTAKELYNYAQCHVLRQKRYSTVLARIYQINRDLLTGSIPCVVLSLLLHLSEGHYYLYVVVSIGLWVICRYTAYLWAREVLRVYLRGKVG